MHNQIFRSLILLVGLLIFRPVVAIDGNYAIPYAPGQDTTQSGSGTVPGGSSYGKKEMELPLSTIVGGVLVVLGAGGAMYWQIKLTRRRQAA